MLSEKVKTYLLGVAREVIASKLLLPVNEAKIPAEGSKDRWVLGLKMGVFVTLLKRGKLRGCIGHIAGVLPLALGVRENAESAAFNDLRFDPLIASEFSDIKIEISVLSAPKKLAYNGAEDLKAKLRAGVDGVVLSKGFTKATYLPQVWDTFCGDSSKEQFLGSLCEKAGLNFDAWRNGDLTVETYQAEVFHE